LKRIILISIFTVIFSLVFPIIIGITEHPPAEIAPSPEVSGSNNEMDETQKAENKLYYNTKDYFTVSLLHEGNILTLPLEEYITGVVAAEMPASFNIEALKAQAVAARTYTIYKMQNGRSENHPNADVCSDITCCKAYISNEALKQRWAADYEKNLEKIKAAVNYTSGIFITYEDKPILAVFHSSSGGMTEKSGNVWNSDLPYLECVETPENTETVPDYNYSVTVSLEDFKYTVAEEYPDSKFNDDPSLWITDITYTESGRIDNLKIGGSEVSGTSLRSLFDLRSTCIAVETTDSDIIFTTTGYGHGVGMSQYGANILADSGANYKEILTWYYTGVDFDNLKDNII